MKQILIVLTALILIVSLHFVQGCFLTKTSEILMVKIQMIILMLPMVVQLT